MKKSEIFKYILTLVVTVGLFVTIFYVTNLANARRASALRVAQDTIAINLLSSETQFMLLNKTDCSSAEQGGLFKSDLKSVQDRLTSLESTLGTSDTEVVNLKKYYALLELKDYLLVTELADRCNFTPTVIMSFTNETCGADCDKQNYVLSSLSDQYPDLRVYSFDEDLDLSAVSTLESVVKIPTTVPALIMKGKVYSGYQSAEVINKIFASEFKKMNAAAKAAAATATSATTATATQ